MNIDREPTDHHLMSIINGAGVADDTVATITKRLTESVALTSSPRLKPGDSRA